MTISRKAFEEGMTVLQARYRSAFDPALLGVYYARLSAELTDAEFSRAIAFAIDEEFLPSPAKIISYARPPAPSPRLAAEDLWSEVLSAIRRKPWRMIQRAEFSGAEWKVIAAAGGLGAICDMTAEAEPHVHRRFLEAYAERAEAGEIGGGAHPAHLTAGEMDPRAAELLGSLTKQLGGGGK